MAMIKTFLVRPEFRLELVLDDDAGTFELRCNPPKQADREEVHKTAHRWVSHIGRGRAHRRTGCMNARVEVIDTWHGASCKGIITQTPT
jgi:hypothetical protein